jgi:hypothetical protein
MRIETAKASITKLAGFFNRKLSEEAIGFYIHDFRAVDDLIFESAVDEACRAEKSFPTPRQLREYVAAAQRAKYAERDAKRLSEIFTDRQNDSEVMTASRGVLRLIYKQNLYGADLVAEMRVMEKTFPGIGWRKAAAELEADLAARNK